MDRGRRLDCQIQGAKRSGPTSAIRSDLTIYRYTQVTQQDAGDLEEEIHQYTDTQGVIQQAADNLTIYLLSQSNQTGSLTGVETSELQLSRQVV